MNDRDLERIADWLTERGLAGASESQLLGGFCDRCRAAGLELSRAMALIDTLHPSFEGRAFRWRSDGVEETAIVEYGRTNQGGEAEASWRRTSFYHLLETGTDEVRRRMLLKMTLSTQYPLPVELPAHLRAYRATMLQHPAMQWAADRYRLHRGRSAEVARWSTAT